MEKLSNVTHKVNNRTCWNQILNHCRLQLQNSNGNCFYGSWTYLEMANKDLFPFLPVKKIVLPIYNISEVTMKSCMEESFSDCL